MLTVINSRPFVSQNYMYLQKYCQIQKVDIKLNWFIKQFLCLDYMLFSIMLVNINILILYYSICYTTENSIIISGGNHV
jgi:hypothetical protein